MCSWIVLDYKHKTDNGGEEEELEDQPVVLGLDTNDFVSDLKHAVFNWSALDGHVSCPEESSSVFVFLLVRPSNHRVSQPTRQSASRPASQQATAGDFIYRVHSTFISAVFTMVIVIA
ncbi:hypothetical protein TCAL_16223 [Tigriopus californicus]|uniref:Uncharacterized protein n=1 Tax=Tigriopus californicus TaxID=6832 RepID=A0A553P4B8_TIGCA|nr:hypothetical protein TCAL_16223 [Tigriopus californicus]